MQRKVESLPLKNIGCRFKTYIYVKENQFFSVHPSSSAICDADCSIDVSEFLISF